MQGNFKFKLNLNLMDYLGRITEILRRIPLCGKPLWATQCSWMDVMRIGCDGLVDEEGVIKRRRKAGSCLGEEAID